MLEKHSIQTRHRLPFQKEQTQDDPATTELFVQPGKNHVNLFSEAHNDNLFSEHYDENLFSEDYAKILFSEEDNGNHLRWGVNHELEGEPSP